VTRPTILVFRIGQLGDTLASIAAIRAIRRLHPTARMVLLTDKQRHIAAVDAWDVLGPTGFFDEVQYFSVPWQAGDLLRTRRAIRALDASRMYYLTPMPRSRWQAARDAFFFRTLCGIRDIVGLEPTPPYPVRDGSNRLVRLESESDRLTAWVTGGAEAASGPDAHRLPIAPVHRDRAARVIAPFAGGRLVAIAPGSKMQAKMWPLDRFAAVGSRLLACWPDVRLVVLGGPHDRPIGDELCRGWGARAVNLVGSLTIAESAAVLERCSLYVGNDTGTMHLAASVGTPCVAIFSARDNPGRWEPAGTGHIVLRHDVPCAGCMLTDCIEHAQQCLTAISVDDVVAAATRCLQQAGTAA
jgi:ADP-heptose:LPS heptosyltransferase